MVKGDIERKSKELNEAFVRMITEMNTSEIDLRLEENKAEKNLYFAKIEEVTDSWSNENKRNWEIMSGFYTGLHTIGIPFAVVYRGQNEKVGVYVGTEVKYIELVEGMLKGTYKHISFKSGSDAGSIAYKTFDKIIDSENLIYGGYLKGNPYCDDKKGFSHPIDMIISGMKKKNWCITIMAVPEKKSNSLGRHNAWLSQNSICSELVNVTYTTESGLINTTHNKTYYQCKEYGDKVEQFIEKTEAALAKGGWMVSVNYAADDEVDSKLLGALLVSSYFGEKSYPEPLHILEYGEKNIFIPKLKDEKDSLIHYNFLSNVAYHKIANILNTDELAMLAAFPTREVSGISISENVEFQVNRSEEGDLELGNIIDGQEISSNLYSIDSNELNRHSLVVGLTGSGKTNTNKGIIYNAAQNLNIPFLVIEPAKKEYWELYKLGLDKLSIYSVGSKEDNSQKLCINPFERVGFKDKDGLIKRVPLQTHIDFIFSAFKASFIMYTPMPYILEKSLYEIYEDVGWDIHNDTNPNGEVYPTMEDLYYKIEDVIYEGGYDAKMRKDLTGSLQARINSMRIGSKGEMLNVQKSFPVEELLEGNVIIELEDIGDDDVKAFMMSVLLIILLEYRRQEADSQLEIKHLLLIEEAHRLLKNIPSGTGENADPRGAAVEFFCNLLAELRSKGQGFIVADQIPSKLAPDLIKNTNIKIVHKNTDAEERELVGGAMHMTESQIDYLSSLKQGVAAVYSEGDKRPVLVKAKSITSLIKPNRNYLSRRDVLEATSKNCTAHSDWEFKSLTDCQTKICRGCNRNCRKNYGDILKEGSINEGFKKFAVSINPHITKKCYPEEIDKAIIDFLAENVNQAFSMDIHNRLCVLNNLIDDWRLERDYVVVLYSYYKSIGIK
ncbi:MAG: ATP-binding protein [Eubacterium sp.]|nr:ATP-binding protein [Eubacterium sp.]